MKYFKCNILLFGVFSSDFLGIRIPYRFMELCMEIFFAFLQIEFFSLALKLENFKPIFLRTEIILSLFRDWRLGNFNYGYLGTISLEIQTSKK